MAGLTVWQPVTSQSGRSGHYKQNLGRKGTERQCMGQILDSERDIEGRTHGARGAYFGLN